VVPSITKLLPSPGQKGSRSSLRHELKQPLLNAYAQEKMAAVTRREKLTMVADLNTQNKMRWAP
jgi:uncharacterized protein (UPF0218 family)